MTLISATDLADIRTDFNTTLFDECVIGTSTGGGFGVKKPKADPWDYTADAIACGVRNTLPKEAGHSEATVVDVVVRVPVGTVVAANSRVKVTKRHEETLATPEFYAVQGEPFAGIGFLSLNCKRVIGNADT